MWHIKGEHKEKLSLFYTFDGLEFRLKALYNFNVQFSIHIKYGSLESILSFVILLMDTEFSKRSLDLILLALLMVFWRQSKEYKWIYPLWS